MKHFILTMSLLISIASYSQDKAKIYFIREAGQVAKAFDYKMFVDGNLICKVPHNMYMVHEVEPGKHEFTSSFGNSKSTPITTLEVEAGKNYYLQVMSSPKKSKSGYELVDISENRAKQAIESMNEIHCK